MGRVGWCVGAAALIGAAVWLVARRPAGEPAIALPVSLSDSESAVASEPLPPPMRLTGRTEPWLRVRNGARLLELIRDGEVRASWPVGLGRARGGGSAGDAGPKVREGDRKTPEGRYRIVNRHDRGPFTLWLGLNYPSAADAERGLREGLVSRSERDAIVAADRLGAPPPAKTKLGGDVGIHGGGATDWTFGCIALDDADIRALWEAVPDGTEVIIEP